MSSWIGVPGALVEITCPSSEDMTPEQSITELVPFSGQRIVQVGPGLRRTWSIGYNLARPHEMAVLDQLAYGWSGALSWVGAQASVTNLLTPGQSAFADDTQAIGGATVSTGALDCGGTATARWAGGPPGSAVRIGFSRSIPVIGGKRVTIRSWVQVAAPGAQMVRTWLDATGSNISSGHVPLSDGWASSSATPPADAASVRLEWRDCLVVACLQMVWADSISEYAPGRGVHRVQLSAATDSLVSANRFLTASSTSYTLMEVG